MRPRIDIRFVTMPGVGRGPGGGKGCVGLFPRGMVGLLARSSRKRVVVLLDILGRQVRTKVGVPILNAVNVEQSLTSVIH